MSVTSASGRGSKMKIEQVMRPEAADMRMGGEVKITIVPEFDSFSLFSCNGRIENKGVMSLRLILPGETTVCAGDRYKVTVERMEDAE